MTQYLLSVHSLDADYETPIEEMQAAFDQVDRYNAEVQTAGAWVFAGGLQPAGTASVVTSKDGQVTTTDGPYAETKEQIGGFWVIGAENLDVALKWAAKASAACMAPVEVRPFQDEPA